MFAAAGFGLRLAFWVVAGWGATLVRSGYVGGKPPGR